MTLLMRDDEKRAEGRAEGESRFASLMRELIASNRYDDIDKAINSSDERERLYQEFGIISELDEKETGVTLTKKYETFFDAVGNIDIDGDAVEELRSGYSLVEKPKLFADDIKAEHKNALFEEAVLRILRMKDPKTFRRLFLKDQSFELIYDISVYGIVPLSDERVGRCILWKYSRGENGEIIDNYKNLDESEKINSFYSYFEKKILDELSKYESTNEKLLNMLNSKN